MQLISRSHSSTTLSSQFNAHGFFGCWARYRRRKNACARTHTDTKKQRLAPSAVHSPQQHKIERPVASSTATAIEKRCPYALECAGKIFDRPRFFFNWTTTEKNTFPGVTRNRLIENRQQSQHAPELPACVRTTENKEQTCRDFTCSFLIGSDTKQGWSRAFVWLAVVSSIQVAIPPPWVTTEARIGLVERWAIWKHVLLFRHDMLPNISAEHVRRGKGGLWPQLDC